MKKEQLKVLKDAKENLDEIQNKLAEAVSEIMGSIDEEIKNVEKLQADIQEEYDDLSEAQQESDKGENLTGVVEALNEVINEFQNLKDTLDADPFEDLIGVLDTAMEK
jgi:DNA repair exonuclease SbcCD ATPase subunit